MSYSQFGTETELQLKKAEEILRAQIAAAAQIAALPPFSAPGHKIDPQVVATLTQSLAANYAARIAFSKS